MCEIQKSSSDVRTINNDSLIFVRPAPPQSDREPNMAETLLRDYRRWLSERKT